MAGAPDPLTPTRQDDAVAGGLSAASGLGRIAIGLGLALAPDLALRALGFGRPSPATVAVSRLAGGRDVVLGALTLAALGDRDRLRSANIACAAVDAGDALTFAVALGDDRTREASLRGLAAAVPAALGGAWLAWRLR